MAKGGCVNGGDLVTTLYSSPVPWIGLYIAAATLVCLIFMTHDFLHGLIRRKPFIPCKWFQLNALTLTLLQVATKIPVDLTASMPRAEDQLSKLTGTTLLCISLGFCMPSLGTMETSERYSNMIALSMMVITVVVNVCIQMRTGPIFAFTTEHIIIIVCMLVLLLLMWSSAIAFRGLIQVSKYIYTCRMDVDNFNVKDVDELESLLVEVHVRNSEGNPQSLLCKTSHHHAFGLLCVISFIVVLRATLRSVVFRTMRFCSGVDDYQWSIPFVIVTQLLTIGVGTCFVVYRWYFFICRPNGIFTNYWREGLVRVDLENLKLKTLSFWVFGKNISVVLQVPKDVLIELLICTQIMLYGCSQWFIGLPIYVVKELIPFFNSDCQHVSEEQSMGLMYERWRKKYNERWRNQKNDDERLNCQTPPENPIISFISKGRHMHASKSEYFVLGRILRRLCEKEFNIYNGNKTCWYKVSSLSVLVLSRMLKELMPSSSSTRWRDFLEKSSKALDESFDIISYVDRNTLRNQGFSIFIDGETRLLLTKNVWANWKNPKHWFHEIISDACTLPKNSENSENYSDQLHHAREVLKHMSLAFDRYDPPKNETLFIMEQKKLILLEISLLCKFILKKKHESIEDLIDFLEMSFVKMLCLTLSALPKAIRKQIQGDYPYGICEGNVREAFKFFYALQSLENIIEWSWEDEVLSLDQEDEVESFFLDAPSTSADHTQVGNPDVICRIDEGVE